MYWLEIYALITAAIFSVAGLFLVVGFAGFRLQAWLRSELNPRMQATRIGIHVALPNTSANLEVQTNE